MPVFQDTLQLMQGKDVNGRAAKERPPTVVFRDGQRKTAKGGRDEGPAFVHAFLCLAGAAGGGERVHRRRVRGDPPPEPARLPGRAFPR